MTTAARTLTADMSDAKFPSTIGNACLCGRGRPLRERGKQAARLEGQQRLSMRGRGAQWKYHAKKTVDRGLLTNMSYDKEVLHRYEHLLNAEAHRLSRRS